MPASEQSWTHDKAQFIAGNYDSVYSAVDTAVDGRSAQSGPLAQRFAQLTRSLLDTHTVAGVLERVVYAAQRVVPGADLVSITLRSPDGSFHTPVETEPVASELDQLQYDIGEGPCVDAARMPGPGHTFSDDLVVEPAWPTFGPAAAARGYHSVLSTALLPDSRPPQLSGALNIYSRRSHGLDALAADLVLLLATHASLALATTRAVSNAELQSIHLHKALDSRDVIGQAKGILMHRRGITADEAFDLLRRTSQDLNVKLTDLAATLTTRHSELDPPAVS